MTLIEVMVAVAVLSLVMSGIALSIGVNFKAVSLARARQVAEAAANKRLEELRDVDYPSMALQAPNPPSLALTQSTDPADPDYFVSTNGLNYDVNGEGAFEPLIVSTSGPITHLETPVTVGTTVVDIYQYVTWVDDPGIPGTQNLKRLSVVVKYQTVPTVGGTRILRESVILTPGTVSLGASATTTTSTTSTSSTSSTSSTTTSGSCGSFSVAGSTGASVGYSSSTTVTITMSLSGCGSNLIANFSNDGGSAWGPDVSYSTASPTVAWTLTAGEGTKTISGRVRVGSSGTPEALPAQSIILDTTRPTVPGAFNRTVSCAGSNRTVNLTWTASTDTYLVGYHVYRSTDGTTWTLVGSTSSLAYSNVHSKSLTSTRFYITAYDTAGNNSNASSIISLSKNQCS